MKLLRLDKVREIDKYDNINEIVVYVNPNTIQFVRLHVTEPKIVLINVAGKIYATNYKLEEVVELINGSKS